MRRHLVSRSLFGFVLSLCVHGIAVFLLRPWPASNQPAAKPVLVELTRSETQPSLPSGRKSGSVLSQSSRTRSPRRAVDSAVTSGLFRDHHVSAIKSGLVFNNSDSDSDAHGWSSAVRYGNAMGLEKTFESLPFYLALHKKIDASLIYPEDFARHRLTGNVRIEALLSSDGRLLRFTSTQAENRVLQTYCLVFLTQILSRPLAPAFHFNTDKSIAVAFDFDFKIRAPEQAAFDFTIGAQKNRLTFGREATVDPWLNEKIVEVLTHYIPPIFPIPGGVYVDFYLAYQWVQNMIEGAPTESEAREARIETLHENLKRSLRTKSTPET